MTELGGLGNGGYAADDEAAAAAVDSTASALLTAASAFRRRPGADAGTQICEELLTEEGRRVWWKQLPTYPQVPAEPRPALRLRRRTWLLRCSLHTPPDL